MKYPARLPHVLLAMSVLFVAATAQADTFDITLSGTAPDSTLVSGSLQLTASPDGLGDGGYSVTAIPQGSLTLEGATYSVSGLTPLDGSVSPLNSAYDAYYICAAAGNCGFHYQGYDNHLLPSATQPFDSGGLLFFAGLGEPVDFYCSSSSSCALSVWVGGANSTLQGLFPSGGNDPADSGFELYTVTVQSVQPVPLPPALLLLVSGIGVLTYLLKRTRPTASALLAA